MTISKSTTPETLSATPVDEWRGALAGLDVLHDVHFGLRDWRRVGDIAECLIKTGADVQSLTIARQADMFVCRCRMTGVSSARARAFAAALSEKGLAEAASVEHLMLAKGKEEKGA